MSALIDTRREFAAVATASSVSQLCSLCQTVRHDVVVLSWDLPGASQESAVTRLLRARPDERVLLVAPTCEELRSRLSRAASERPPGSGLPAACSAVDCTVQFLTDLPSTIRSDASPGQLFAALRAVANGGQWLSDMDLQRLKRSVTKSRKGGNGYLSAREMDVASCIGQGMSNKEIAEHLGLTTPTVKKHVGGVLSKFHVLDRLQVGVFVARCPLFSCLMP